MPASKMARLAADAAVFSSILLLLLLLPTFLVVADSDDPVHPGPEEAVGTRWAVLVAGSSGYWNYRHQADVCHAYQILKKGGLKDENIVVFMYDDIANNIENPRPGIVINHPKGKDVYAGVPKDYVGDDITVNNFFAVILGNKSALTGGSGKVVNSGPNDHIFVYYSDHGSPGSLGMPMTAALMTRSLYSTLIMAVQGYLAHPSCPEMLPAMPTPPHIYAGDLVNLLKKKHASKSYKSLVFYLESCESGSIFEGLLSEGLKIYATTASGATEDSWATYCPEVDVGSRSPPKYTTCLGDLYSVSWMEDSDAHDLRKRTLKQQYDQVRNRTSAMQTYEKGSHVMQYGDLNLNSKFLVSYVGSGGNETGGDRSVVTSLSAVINQRDADLVHFWNKFMRSTEGSSSKIEAQKELVDVLSHRLHVDNSIELVRNILSVSGNGMEVLKAVRPAGQPLVDDWACLKTMVRTFETYCGSLNQYGLKHMRALANICNAGISTDKMIAASSQACKEFPSNPWSSLRKGYSA